MGWLSITVLSLQIARVVLPVIGAGLVLLVKHIHGNPAPPLDTVAIMVGAVGFTYHAVRTDRTLLTLAQLSLKHANQSRGAVSLMREYWDDLSSSKSSEEPPGGRVCNCQPYRCVSPCKTSEPSPALSTYVDKRIASPRLRGPQDDGYMGQARLTEPLLSGSIGAPCYASAVTTDRQYDGSITRNGVGILVGTCCTLTRPLAAGTLVTYVRSDNRNWLASAEDNDSAPGTEQAAA